MSTMQPIISRFEITNSLHFDTDEPSCATMFDLLSSPEYGIPDSAFTASSEWTTYLANASRLTTNDTWAPAITVGAWIRADLGETRLVMAIRTGGRAAVYITQYEIATSMNGVDWADVVDNEGSTVVFEGNNDGSTIVSNLLPTPIETRHVQLTIVSFEWYPELRWAVDGCPVPTD